MKNVQSSVMVGIGSEAARGTDEGRLVLAASTVHGSTCRTGLRRMARVNLHDTMRLVKQHRLDLVPTHVKNGAVEATLLSDIPAWRFNSPGDRCRHIFDLKAFDNNSSELAADVSCHLVRPMLADTGLFSLNRSNPTNDFRPAARATFAAAGDALSLSRLALKSFDSIRHGIHRAVRKHQRNRNATVDTDFAARVGSIFVNLAPNGDMPAKRRQADGCFSHLPTHVAGHAELDPADLREPNAAPSVIQSLDEELPTIEREGVVLAFFLGLRKTAKAIEGAAVSIIKRLQDVLLRRLADLADEIDLSAQPSKLSRLRHVIEVVTSTRLEVSPMATPLLKREVPYQTADPGELEEFLLLRRRRL